MPNRHIVDRALPERSKLSFYFPVPTTGGYNYVIDLPFFENIVIKENKKAKYQKYSLISRSSNLYSYLGADSRKFKLSFNMTLPHILEEHPDLTLDRFVRMDVDKDNLESEKVKFKNPSKVDSVPKGMAFQIGNEYTKKFAKDSAKMVLVDAVVKNSLNEQDRAFMQSRYGINQTAVDITGNLVNNFETNPFSVASNISNAAQANQQVAEQEIANDQDMQLKYRIIDLIVYWVNIVRSSVVNYSQNPIYGPPIIRLKHGIMYQDIPCICTDYSIQFREAAGYDINTLLPRQINVSMSLEEIRTGDFGVFDPGAGSADAVKRDNLAGWESVVLEDYHSMDPGVGRLS